QEANHKGIQSELSQPPSGKTENPQRNPFKVLNEGPKPVLWKQISEERRPAEEKHWENKGIASTGEENVSFQGWRGKELPAGLKVKNRMAEKDGRPAEKDARERFNKAPEGERSEDCTRQGGDSDNSEGTRDSNAKCQKDQAPEGSDKDGISQLHSSTKNIEGTAGLSEGHSKDTAKVPRELGTGSQKSSSQAHENEDDVVFVCSQPGAGKLPPTRTSGEGKQRTIPSFPGFALQTETQSTAALHSQLTSQLKQKKATLATVNLQALPDRGERLLKQVQDLEGALDGLSLSIETSDVRGSSGDGTVLPQTDTGNPFSKPATADGARGVKPLSFHELPPSTLGLHGSAPAVGCSQNYSNLYGGEPSVTVRG
ncbi:hypothetical protein FKM82_022912, partial [Ascaphus truei]